MRSHALLSVAVAAAITALFAPLGGAAGNSPFAAIAGAHARGLVEGTLDARLDAVATAPSAVARAAAARSAGIAATGTRVRVMVEAKQSAAAAAVASVGGTVELADAGLTQALVAPAALQALAGSAGIRRVRPPAVFRADAGQGVQYTNAQAWQAAGVNGAGTKVAIIDLGFQGSLGDPNLSTATRVDMCPGQIEGDPHGRAVADIVHDMAPGAQLYLICVDSELTLEAAKNYVLANGIKIVSHSVSWYGTSRGDGSGDPNSPNAIVADARAHGVLWINSAGNDAQDHWSDTFSDPSGNGFEKFSGGDELNRVVVSPGETGCVISGGVDAETRG